MNSNIETLKIDFYYYEENNKIINLNFFIIKIILMIGV